MQTEKSRDIGPVEFIVLVACIMLLTAVAIDIMLPAFGDLRDYFGLGRESTATAQIVTFFFLGQAGQLIFGPLADRFGRLRVMRIGFALYITGCVVAALSPSFGLILAARFVVGLGAAALGVAATTSVRDRFSGDRMARTMSLILTIFLGVPVVAPLIGSLILSVSSWQVVFLTPALVAVLVFIWSLRLRESLPPERRLKLDVPTLAGSARQVLGNRTFLRYSAITTVLFGVFSSYISSSERMISEVFGRPELFTWIFSGVGITMACFTFLNAQLVQRFGARRVIRGLLTAYLLLAVVLFVVTMAAQGMPNIFVFFAIIALLQGINVAVEPNSGAMALEPLGSTAGMAAAVYGTSFFVIGSLVGSFIDRMLVNSVAPLAVGYLIVALITTVIAYMARPQPATDATPNTVASTTAAD